MPKPNSYILSPEPVNKSVSSLLGALFYVVFGLTLIAIGGFCVLITMGVIHIDPEWLKINRHTSFPLLLLLMPGGLGISGGLLLVLEVLGNFEFYGLKPLCHVGMGVSVLLPPLIWLCMGTQGVLDSGSRIVLGIIFGVFGVGFLVSMALSFVPGLGERNKTS